MPGSYLATGIFVALSLLKENITSLKKYEGSYQQITFFKLKTIS